MKKFLSRCPCHHACERTGAGRRTWPAAAAALGHRGRRQSAVRQPAAYSDWSTGAARWRPMSVSPPARTAVLGAVLGKGKCWADCSAAATAAAAATSHHDGGRGFPARTRAPPSCHIAVGCGAGFAVVPALAAEPNFFVSDDITISASARSPELSVPCARVRSNPHTRSSPSSRVMPTHRSAVRARNGESR